MAKKGKATKQTILMLTPETHLRLKIAAVSQGTTMGRTILGMLEKCYPLDVRQRLSLKSWSKDPR
ncbi:MAG: hypothetical protein OER59_08090 [Desulfobulbaceae bacterium]|jgi:hypothetical protein|nr:hypothetical protein [Desulfobacteraceae bacterium]MDH3574340.1 hypothetical protein [Desulfobacteraceae bacterium]MDH3777004.1 hypothetical protein [Desulfobulbaceae bacterium]MDH3782169.1 hypothetical protein [Desulfobulbaceae bacterium]MDH3865581.1 hypothetical protein [Desulfobulbaceae bacterium]